MTNRITQYLNPIKRLPRRATQIIKRKPLTSFFTVLSLLFILVIINNTLNQPQTETAATTKQPKTVSTYQIGQAPRITVNASIEKSGVVTIQAQTGGIVQNIYVEEGSEVSRGSWIVGLSSNYQGGNAFALQSQIAQRSHQFNKNNYQLQQEMISKRRDLAEKTDVNADELRTITNDSKARTEEIINLSKESIKLIDDQIIANETAATPSSTLSLSLKGQKLNLLNALSAAEAGLRNAEYAGNDAKPPADLSNISKDLTLKQLDLESKSLTLSLEISELNARLAQVNAAMMAPAAPFTGRVERIHVKVGQAVNPGQPIATFSGTDQTITAVALLPQNIAQNISKLEPSILMFGDQKIEAMPTHIAQEATNGQLMAVIYPINQDEATTDPALKGYQTDNSINSAITQLTQGELITISIPVGYTNSTSIIPFVPLDAIYQTQEAAYLFVLNSSNQTVESRQVSIGKVYGSFVQVTSGLADNDTIILDRTVVSGETVNTQ